MPIKIRHEFEREYGKKKGDRIFYSWENKHHMLPRDKMLQNRAEKTLNEELRERHEFHKMHPREEFKIHPQHVKRFYPY